MRKITKWIQGTTRFSFKVLCFDDLEEAKYWLDMYVAKADRDQYVIYKLLKEKE